MKNKNKYYKITNNENRQVYFSIKIFIIKNYNRRKYNKGKIFLQHKK